jgi:tRNA (adenine22-N1)-methyltransferase
MVMHIGKRLEAIGRLVPPESNLADIGTDHAYLPVWLIRNNIIHHAIATDIATGPCEAARKTIQDYGMQLLVDIRQGDGFETIEPGEVGSVVMAGMGASTMLDIMQARPQVVNCLNSIILQPMTGAPMLRKWAVSKNLEITAESLCRENEHFYVAMVLKHSKSYAKTLTPLELEVGPCLLEHGPSLLKAYVAEILADYKLQLERMSQSAQASQSEKFANIQALCKELEVLYHGS